MDGKRQKLLDENNNLLPREHLVVDNNDMSRPKPRVINHDVDSILVNWIDIDMYAAAQPLSTNPKKGEIVPGSTLGPVPVIRFFGVSHEGCSVAVHVHGFTPYFYCDPPSSDFDESHLAAFRENLESRLAQAKRGAENAAIRVHVLSVQLCKRQSVFGFSANVRTNMIQIFIASPSLVATARGILERGFKPSPSHSELTLQTYESNVPFVLRYMVDHHIVGCNWIELKPGTYCQRMLKTQETRCQLEFDVVYDQVVSHPPQGQFSRVGKLRIFSFDIEFVVFLIFFLTTTRCMGRKGHFPDPKFDSVIQIANFIYTHGEDLSTCKKIVFVLGGCSPIVNAKVVSFNTESELLLAWSDLMRVSDPDVLTGYNIQNFDMPYLMNRAKELKIDMRFENLGRIVNQRAKMKNSTFSSSAFGTRDSVDTQIDGNFNIYPMLNRQLMSLQRSRYA